MKHRRLTQAEHDRMRQEYRYATARELAEKYNITPRNVRYHCDPLPADERRRRQSTYTPRRCAFRPSPFGTSNPVAKRHRNSEFRIQNSELTAPEVR